MQRDQAEHQMHVGCCSSIKRKNTEKRKMDPLILTNIHNKFVAWQDKENCFTVTLWARHGAYENMPLSWTPDSTHNKIIKIRLV